ncbi:hypothetical protein EXU57_04920 [Segetibacter sp. 3557_3]|uniref:hypothetical protein n=1 Tax=Segetibacter sp. 3557_3 TaxID=2547429 RepID=UPI0010589AA8|nr:hypothetical protein [Segetibacter sp. 3557_3]TDH27815.1 hypothetical protein EXU57_04920 [Segetibacter sp. 3557_3]
MTINKYNPVFALIVVGILAGCENRKTATALVMERKKLGNNKLLIKYAYMTGGERMVDSAIITNEVLESDSIKVILDKDNPGKSTPELLK